jgi:hypothetical protein
MFLLLIKSSHGGHILPLLKIILSLLKIETPLMKKILMNLNTKFREICSTEVKVTQYDKIFITADMINEWSMIPGTFRLLKERWVKKGPKIFYFFFHWSH